MDAVACSSFLNRERKKILSKFESDNFFWKALGYVIYSGGQLDLQRCKPSITTSNVALNVNPGTVLKTARPEDSKTPPTCSN